MRQELERPIWERGSASHLAYAPDVPDMVRMGVRAVLAEDQRPISTMSSTVVMLDEAGNELAREEVVEGPPLVLSVIHFVDLDDGTRVTTEDLGEMRLTVWRDCTPEQLHEELREFIFEDELREVDEELAAEPRWEDMSAALQQRGVAADDAALLALPFVVELDNSAAGALRRAR